MREAVFNPEETADWKVTAVVMEDVPPIPEWSLTILYRTRHNPASWFFHTAEELCSKLLEEEIPVSEGWEPIEPREPYIPVSVDDSLVAEPVGQNHKVRDVTPRLKSYQSRAETRQTRLNKESEN